MAAKKARTIVGRVQEKVTKSENTDELVSEMPKEIPIPTTPIETNRSVEEFSKEQLKELFAKVRKSKLGEYILTTEERQIYEDLEKESHARWLALHAVDGVQQIGQTNLTEKAVLDQQPMTFTDDGKLLVIQLPENLRWKLSYHEEKKEHRGSLISMPIKQHFLSEMNKAIQAALDADEEYQALVNSSNIVINEVLDRLEPQIPIGFGPKQIINEKGVLVAAANEASRGARMPVK